MTEASPHTPAAPAAAAPQGATTDPATKTEPQAPSEVTSDNLDDIKAERDQWKAWARKHEAENKQMKERVAVADSLEASAADNGAALTSLTEQVNTLKEALASNERLATRMTVASAAGVPVELLPDVADKAELEKFATSLAAYKGAGTKAASVKATHAAPSPTKVDKQAIGWGDALNGRHYNG